MFSIIITIIAIALVALLALATMYYGRNTAAEAGARTAAATLVNQGQQIAAAGALAISQGDSWPAGTPAFTQPYLKAMPTPPRAAYVSGEPSIADWQYFLPGQAKHFALVNKIRQDVCLAVNRAQGVIGIPAAWDGTHMVQCFGPGVAGANGLKAYTFLYDPPNTTSTENNSVLQESVVRANAAMAANPIQAVPEDVTPPGAAIPVTASTPGYPLLCPSGNYINAGVCQDVVPKATGGVASITETPAPTDTAPETTTPPAEPDPVPDVPPSNVNNVSLYCEGNYSEMGLDGWCHITNNSSNPVVVTKRTTLTAIDGRPLKEQYPTDCVGETLAANGGSCDFWPIATPYLGSKLVNPYEVVDVKNKTTGVTSQVGFLGFTKNVAPKNVLSCTGEYSDIGLRSTCTVTNTESRTMWFTGIRAFDDTGLLESSAGDCAIGQEFQPGDSCSFSFNGWFGPMPSAAPVITINWAHMCSDGSCTDSAQSYPSATVPYKPGAIFVNDPTVLSNPTGNIAWVRNISANSPSNEYWMEFDVQRDTANVSLNSWMDVKTTGSVYEFYWFMQEGEIEVDMLAPNGDFAYAPALNRGQSVRYRVEFEAGNLKRVLANGKTVTTSSGDPHWFYDFEGRDEPGRGVSVSIGPNLSITRVRGGAIWAN
jgi:hypothetical protein